MTLATPPFWKFFGVMSGLSLGTRVSNLKSVALTILELLAFYSHFKLVWLTGPLRTHRHISNEHIISANHFVHLAEIKMPLTTSLKHTWQHCRLPTVPLHSRFVYRKSSRFGINPVLCLLEPRWRHVIQTHTRQLASSPLLHLTAGTGFWLCPSLCTETLWRRSLCGSYTAPWLHRLRRSHLSLAIPGGHPRSS